MNILTSPASVAPERAARPEPAAPIQGLAGPWEQAIRLAFGALTVSVVVLAVGWATSNFRQVPPESRAIVLRLGAFAREQASGLLLAWPAPIEQVMLLPAADRQLELPIVRFELFRAGRQAPDTLNLSPNARQNTGFLLTGDTGVIHLSATLFYRIADPAAYVVARDHVPAALERLFIASAVAAVASRDLDSILVARPLENTSDATDDSIGDRSQGARERLRADLLRDTNARLTALASQGAGLGVRVQRVDMLAALPTEARGAFDEVLRASQAVDTAIAKAQTAAASSAAMAVQQRTAMLILAHAAAAELRAQAVTRTASLSALSAQTGGPLLVAPGRAVPRPAVPALAVPGPSIPGRAVLERLYAERIAQIIHRAGQVQVLDPAGGTRLILPGTTPSAPP